MNMKHYSAGKGVRFPADLELLTNVMDAMAVVTGTVEEFNELKADRRKPEDVIKYLVSEGFNYKSDDFGVSAYKGWDTGKGDEQLRVAVVLNGRGILQVDIRNWYASV